MSDQTIPTEDLTKRAADDPVALPVDFEEAPKRARRTTIVVALVAFALLAGMTAGAVYVFVLGPGADDAAVPTAEGSVGTAQEGSVEGLEPSEPSQIPLKRVFTFRDVFEPLIQPAPEPSQPTSPTADPSEMDDTLTLLDITSVDGEPAAVLKLNGEQYTLKVGDAIAGTPWKVLSITDTSVLMQYGDTTVPLSIGQGFAPITK